MFTGNARVKVDRKRVANGPSSPSPMPEDT